MRTFAIVVLTAVLSGLGGWTATFSSASVADRSVEQILKELDRIKIPSYDSSKKDDPPYTRQFLVELRDVTETRAALILELYKADPDHDRIPALMAERWGLRPYSLPADKLSSEIDDVLAYTGNQRLRIEGIFARTYAAINDSPRDEPFDPSVIDEFLKLAPKDSRCATLLQRAAGRTQDEKVKTALEDRILREFPATAIAQRLRGIRHQGDRVGKPLHLDFTDAISGVAVSVEKLKGKVVVIDFWATWCVPCVVEMPEMKKLYAKYHEQGVEFLGVSLDQPEEQGGLDRLKKYVKEKEIAWPQYYQGDGWNSVFSSSCGIQAIPTVFVIDAEGNLYSTEAHGRLDDMIPWLLKKTTKSGEGPGPRGE
jgi:thiol-disulfide isomerase/thioredoxin